MKNPTRIELSTPVTRNNSPLRHSSEKHLWTSSEAIILCGLNVVVFGFTMGGGHYDFVFSLLLPSLALGVAIGVAELAFACWRDGPKSLPIVQTLLALGDDLGEAFSLADIKPLRPTAKLLKKFRACARHPSLRS